MTENPFQKIGYMGEKDGANLFCFYAKGFSLFFTRFRGVFGSPCLYHGNNPRLVRAACAPKLFESTIRIFQTLNLLL